MPLCFGRLSRTVVNIMIVDLITVHASFVVVVVVLLL